MAFKKYLLHTGEYLFSSSIPFAGLHFSDGADLLDYASNEVLDDSDAMPKVFSRKEDAMEALGRLKCSVRETRSVVGYEITAEIPFVEECLCDEDMTVFDGSQDIWDIKTLAVADL